MASAKVWLMTSMPPVLTVSVDKKPDKLPDPYLDKINTNDVRFC
jgi:hypothetical protein